MSSRNDHWRLGATALALAATMALSWPAAASPTVSAARSTATTARIAHRPRPPEITASEAARLRHQHQQYQQMKRLANADGEISRGEQARLNHKAQQLRHSMQIAKTN